MISKACTPAAGPVNGRGGSSVQFLSAKPTRDPARYMGNSEPDLEELLTDDVLVRLMARDGVAAQQLRDMAARFRG